MTDVHSLEARDLTLAYDGAPVVEGLTLHVPPGQVTAVVGANACGKSTLLRALARVLRPESGSVLLPIPTTRCASRARSPTRPTAPSPSRWSAGCGSVTT